MTPIIYNLNTVALPLSGTGRYTVELIKAVSALRSGIVGVKGRQAYTGGRLLSVLNGMEQPNNEALVERGFNWSHSANFLRKALRNTPYSRQVYDAINRRALAKTSQAWSAEGGKYHDLNYSLDPKGDHLCTVYDLSNIVCASTHPKSRVSYLNTYFAKLSHTRSPIITISEAVKHELMEHYKVDESRIHVTHLAADEAFYPRGSEACRHTLNSYSLAYKQYVLCVATLEPRKNLSNVLDAYTSLDSQIQAEFPLVMVGATGWKSSMLAKRIHRLHEAGKIKQLGFVSQHDLPVLYAGASAFVYPSLYEGFGLPLLEAMQSGCPCITSNTGALLEVSAGHALQIDPYRTDDIANEMNRLLCDSTLNTYYAELGMQRAADFSWAKTARATCDVYSQL